MFGGPARDSTLLTREYNLPMRNLMLLLALLPAAAFAYDAPHLDYVEPYRLKVQTAGSATLEVYGTYPLATEGHSDRTQYEHWAVRRIDRGGAWTPCGDGGACRMGNWTRTTQKLELSSELLNTPGLLELQLQEGLLEPFGVSNILRLPVLAAFGAPPVIVNVDKTRFPVNGKDDDYVFRIAANNFDDSVRVVFGESKYAIAPRRVLDGTTIEVAVPKAFRATAHDANIYLRTDRGGMSAPKTISLVAPAPPKVIRVMVPMAPKAGAAATTTGAVTTTAATSTAATTVKPVKP